MALSYVVLLVLAAVSIAIPASLILVSRLIRMRRASSASSRLNFESGEQTIGTGASLMSEYFHYFTGFLAFEIVAALAILWAYSEGVLPVTVDYYFFGLLAFAVIMGLFVLLLASRRGVHHG